MAVAQQSQSLPLGSWMKMTQLRLLFLLPFAPRLDATHGGGRATAQLIAGLTARHQVALIYLRAPAEPPVDDILRKRCALVEEILRPNGGFSLAQRWSRLNSLLRGRPLWATFTAVAAYRARVRTLARTWQPDIVQIEFHVMGQYLSALDGCRAPRVLTEHEPGAKAARDMWQSRRGFARVPYYLNRLAWERFERTIFGQVQAVVVFTENDRQAVAQLTQQTPIVRIPLGTMLSEQPLNPLGCLPISLVFVGSFIHPPNVDAAMRLITAIFPEVQARFPELILYVVGDRPPRQIHQMANKNIVVTGRVSDVTPYLDRATLVIVPLRLGGGMRVKVLEALAAGKAVVASPLAIEGLDIVDGDQICLAESDQDFVEQIVQLLDDADRRASLAARARAWACANLGWEKSIAAYEALYESLIQSSGGVRQTQ
jgi:glycosyltransferase involved in cell wall biosynthesis